tara:strand:- start:2869 stop:4302 length:1434 start_codon:yes stop_codon:yes gene_type:complete
MIRSFLNQILVNFKTSNNLFFANNDTKFTYKKAYKRLSSFNTFFKKHKKEKIAVFSDKSIDYYIVVLGIFLSGNTWVQISPSLPTKKVSEIIKFSKIKIGVYDNSFNNKKIFKLKKIKIYKLSYLSKLKPSNKFSNFKNIDKEDISCIFFTSGSSGKPKGVELTYQNVISCAKYQIKNLGYKNKQIFADCHDTGFVMSLVVIFPAVILRGTFSPLMSLGDKLSPIDYFLENKIDNLITVPSFILFNKEKISKLNLDNLILCGENFPYKILNILLKKTKINSIYNCYGATELSPWAFFYKLNLGDIKIIKKLGKVPIGKPFKGINYSFNDLNELIIEGNVVAKGYLNNNEETKKKFLSDKKINKYNTGDIGFKYHNLVFVSGRNDSQVKIKGHRVDLNEVENIARKFKNNLFTFCFLKKNKLTLIYNNEKSESKEEFLKFLKNNLSNYMVPNKIIYIKKIPFNKNGKIDRLKLKNYNV